MSDLYLFIKFINIKIKMSKANLNGSDDFFDYQNDRSVYRVFQQFVKGSVPRISYISLFYLIDMNS